MKLYYFAGAPTLGAHISLREAEIEPELVQVDFTTMLVDGQPFGEVNPKGYVPALILDDGSMLTENVAILDWIAQQSPSLRPSGPMERTRLIEMLAFISNANFTSQFPLTSFFLPWRGSQTGSEAITPVRAVLRIWPDRLGLATFLANLLRSRGPSADCGVAREASDGGDTSLPRAFKMPYCARI